MLDVDEHLDSPRQASIEGEESGPAHDIRLARQQE